MATFEDARQIVEEDVPGGAVTASYGFESDDSWFPIVLPERLGGRVPAVSKETGALAWVSSLSDEYSDSRPYSDGALSDDGVMVAAAGRADVVAVLSALRSRLSGGDVRDELDAIIADLQTLTAGFEVDFDTHLPDQHNQADHGHRRTGTLGSVLDRLGGLRSKLGGDDLAELDRAMDMLRNLESSDVDDDDLEEPEVDDDPVMMFESYSAGDVEMDHYTDGSITVQWGDGEGGFRFDTPQEARDVAALFEKVASAPGQPDSPSGTLIAEATTPDGKWKVARWDGGGPGSVYELGEPDDVTQDSEPYSTLGLEDTQTDEANDFARALRELAQLADEVLAARPTTAGSMFDADVSQMPAQLQAYWLTGEGAAKVKWCTEGSFRRARRLMLAEGVPARMVNGTVANLYRKACGKNPGRHTSLELDTRVFREDLIDRDGQGQFADQPGGGVVAKAKRLGPKASAKKTTKPTAKAATRRLFAPPSQKEMKEVTDPAKLALLGEMFGTSHAGMTSKIGTVSASNNRVAVKGVITGPDGEKIGEFEREIRLDRRGGMFADHKSLVIDPKFQGQGFAREFNNKAIDGYRAAGMDRVQLFANIDVGAFAWARGGWDWASIFDAETLKVRLREMADGKDKKSARLASEMLGRFEDSEFGTPGFPTPFELSEMGRTTGQGKGDTWPGQQLFRSHADPDHPDHLGWNAEMPLKGKSRVVVAAAGLGGREEMMAGLAAEHDRWVDENLDDTEFVSRDDSKDFNLYYVDVDGSGAAQDELAAAFAELLASGTDETPTVAGMAGDRWFVVENSVGCSSRFAVTSIDGIIDGCFDTRVEAFTHIADLNGLQDTFGPPDRSSDLSAPPGALWHAVVHTEGISTGKRTWLPQSVEWRPPPFALHQEVSSSAHGGQPVTVYVGNTLAVARTGNAIHLWGDIDLDSQQGLEWARKLMAGYGGWPSFGPGSEAIEYDLIHGPTPGQEPQQIVFRKYRMGEVTAVSVPGQEGTYFEPLPALVDALGARAQDSVAPIVVAGSSSSSSHTVVIPNLPPPDWFTEPDAFPHGYAVVMEDNGHIYGLVAPDGEAHRTYHQAGERRTLGSLGKIDLTRYMRETIVEGGQRVYAGPLTMECMHAPTQGYGRLDRRNQFYQDTCSVFARVAVGMCTDGAGMWLNGAAMPGVTSDQVLKFLACGVSLDVQPHPEKRGWLELVAVLVVPSEGWAKSKQGLVSPVTRIRETEDGGVLVASVVPTVFDGPPLSPRIDSSIVFGIAADAGINPETRIAADAAKVTRMLAGR